MIGIEDKRSILVLLGISSLGTKNSCLKPDGSDG